MCNGAVGHGRTRCDVTPWVLHCVDGFPLRPIPAKKKRGWGNTPKRRMQRAFPVLHVPIFPAPPTQRQHERQHEQSRWQNPHTAFTTSAGPQAARSTCNHHRSQLRTSDLFAAHNLHAASLFYTKRAHPLDVTPWTLRTSPLVSSPFHRARRSQDYWSSRPADASTSSPSGDSRVNRSCARTHDRNGRQGRLPGWSGPASRRRERGQRRGGGRRWRGPEQGEAQEGEHSRSEQVHGQEDNGKVQRWS